MKRLLVAGTVLAALGASQANAGTFAYDHYSWIGEGISIFSPNNISGGSGRISLYDKNNVLLADAWCMDVQSYLTGSGLDGITPAVPAVQEPGFPVGGLSTAQLTTIEELVVLGDPDNNSHDSAAIQVAIWSTEYGAGFSSDWGDPGLVTTLLADAANTSISGYAFNFLVPQNPEISQTLIYGSPTTKNFAAPEPSTWAMGLIGFAVLGMAGYSRKKTARFIEA